MNTQIQKTIENLKHHQFDACYVSKKEEVLPLVKEFLPKGAMIANGGSVTLRQTGLIDLFKSGDYDYLTLEGVDPSEFKNAIRKRFFADYFFLSANAITEDGRIFQEDGASTRVAPMIYGPDHVIMVVGQNKIVETEQKARARIKQIAAPQNCKNNHFNTPCAVDGICHNCDVAGRSCCTSVTLNFSRIPNRIKVIIVGEDLGL